MRETVVNLLLVAMGATLGALLMWAAMIHTHPPACGATGPLVVVLREVDDDVACTLTGTITNAHIELVEGE